MLGLRKSGGRFLDKSVLFSCFPSAIALIRLPNDTICPSQDCSVQRKTTPCNATQYNKKDTIQCNLPRVAKCNGYGGYIHVKILEGWGKKFARTFSFAKSGNVLGKFEQLI